MREPLALLFEARRDGVVPAVLDDLAGRCRRLAGVERDRFADDRLAGTHAERGDRIVGVGVRDSDRRRRGVRVVVVVGHCQRDGVLAGRVVGVLDLLARGGRSVTQLPGVAGERSVRCGRVTRIERDCFRWRGGVGAGRNDGDGRLGFRIRRRSRVRGVVRRGVGAVLSTRLADVGLGADFGRVDQSPKGVQRDAQVLVAGLLVDVLVAGVGAPDRPVVLDPAVQGVGVAVVAVRVAVLVDPEADDEGRVERLCDPPEVRPERCFVEVVHHRTVVIEVAVFDHLSNPVVVGVARPHRILRHRDVELVGRVVEPIEDLRLDLVAVPVLDVDVDTVELLVGRMDVVPVEDRLGLRPRFGGRPTSHAAADQRLDVDTVGVTLTEERFHLAVVGRRHRLFQLFAGGRIGVVGIEGLDAVGIGLVEKEVPAAVVAVHDGLAVGDDTRRHPAPEGAVGKHRVVGIDRLRVDAATAPLSTGHTDPREAGRQ